MEYSGRSVVNFWSDADYVKFFAQLFLIQAWIPVAPGWNIPSWSISAEIFAYCLFPVLARTLRRWPASASVVMLVMSMAFYGYVGARTGSLDIVSGTAPLRCLAGFLLGMLAYQYRSHVAGLPSWAISAGQAVAALAIVLFLALPMNDVAIVPAFLALVVLTWSDMGWLFRILSRPVFQFLGEISYSVYLNHVPLFLLLYPLTLAAGHRAGLDPMTVRALWFPIATAAVIVLSFGTYRLIELPARKWLNGQWQARRAGRKMGLGATA